MVIVGVAVASTGVRVCGWYSGNRWRQHGVTEMAGGGNAGGSGMSGGRSMTGGGSDVLATVTL